MLEVVGVCLDDSLLLAPVAIGKLRDNLLGLAGVYESARVCLTGGRGGAAIENCSLFGEFPTCAWGDSIDCGVSPEVSMDSTEAGSMEDRRRLWLSMVHIVC